jgi:cytochrome c oxidase subunit 2
MQGATVISNDSPEAAAILNLFTIVISIAGVIFLVVLSIAIVNIIRFRRSRARGEPFQDFGNPRLEAIWTLVPAAILGFVFFITVRAMNKVTPPHEHHPVDIIVTANQWWWKAAYPGSAAVVANEMHMPVDQVWLLKILSADVIHDFWVPQLSRKVDAIPNHPNYLWIQPLDTGWFSGMCAEYCGAEHAWMRFTVVVEPQPEYQAWLAHQAENAHTPDSGEAAEGMQIFMDMTCRNCHTIRGTPADGIVGADLTHVASRRKIAGGVLDFSPEDLTRWLLNPQYIKPGCHMPNLDLAAPRVHKLAAYLEYLK